MLVPGSWMTPARPPPILPTFSFVDGHAEGHKWLDPTTIDYATSTAVGKESDSDGTKEAAQNDSIHDQTWIGSRYPGPQNP